MFHDEKRTDEAYNSLQRKQVFLWMFLVLFVLGIGGGIFMVSWQVIKSGQGGIAPASFVTPLASVLGGAQAEVAARTDFALWGEYSRTDGRYRIFRIYLSPFSKEEIFSFPWNDLASAPMATVQGKYLGVFFGPGNGLLLHTNGRLVPLNEFSFIPPTGYFTISPDGKRMIYFKMFSTVGTAGAFVRDIGKEADVFGWPIGSEASRVCEFVGWSGDGRKAYCLAREAKRTEVRVYDAVSFSHSVAGSAPGAADAVFLPAASSLIFATGPSVFALNTATKTRQEIARLTDETGTVERVRVSADGATIFFSGTGGIFSVESGGGTPRKLADAGRLVAIAPDGSLILFERSLESGDKVYFTTSAQDGSGQKQLWGTSPDILHPAYIGWVTGEK